MKKLIAIIILAATSAQAQTWHRVAYDDAGTEGKQTHLVNGGNWRFENPGTDDEALRTCAFGDRVEFQYTGLNTNAQYKAKLRFFSDAEREIRIVPGNVTAKLTAGQPVVKEVDLPATDPLVLALEKISGPNAVVSDVEILSTDPKPLAAACENKVERWLNARPRYIARPTEIISLNGQWSFCPDGPTGTDWKPIEVPGEWVMQGFNVKPNTAAGYRRTFTVPKGFAGQRVILRFDGVYSDTTVTLNGKIIGSHLGGFTPFEFDVTDTLKAGENELAVAVKNESLADKMASGSKYAEHPLGGIPRKVTLFAVPAVHVEGLEITATPDETLMKANVHLVFQVVNTSKAEVRGIKAKVKVAGAEGSEKVTSIPAGGRADVVLDVPAAKPALWDTEHPNLHLLTLTLSTGQTIEQHIGFKRIEVRGNQLFVNNMPVKLRGGCRHETHPTRGRSLTPELWRRDAELYREANFNVIRTSHYPPAEEFVAACDELGLFVECEAPMCWSGTDENYILSSTLEMAGTYRNHASVLFWSLGNESPWCPAYKVSHDVLKALDPARPTTVEYPHGDNDHGTCEIASTHYPGPGGPGRYRDAKRPTNYGEYCHLNAYNRFELAADPGIRDAWGRGFRKMWDAMFTESQGTVGGSLWAAMDDTFHLPDGRSVGYGTWGPLDNWRRTKPEYWHSKKTYSPVRIDESRQNLPVNATIELPVLNQSDFSNLREFDIRWSIGMEKGRLDADVAPHSKGTLRITPKHQQAAGDILKIEVRDPRGFVADEYAFTFGGQQPPAVRGGKQFDLNAVSRTTGLLTGDVSGPILMVLPLNGGGGTQMGGKYYYPPDNRAATDWKMSAVDAKADFVTLTGEYAGAKGSFTYTAGSNGELCVAYRFTMKQKINPRQVGLVFDLPKNLNTIAWKRNAPYTVYPADHIGRPSGTASAFGKKDRYVAVKLREQPTWPWSEDVTEGGINDFRSTKENIVSYSVTDAAWKHGVEVISDGKQHARAWVDGDKVRLLVADYSNAGAEGFFRSHAGREDHPLKAGDEISGVIRLKLR
ncbi:MAG: glycoside hydrolase family 2 [Candidatus Pacebacteria bacterium]|nr:glycoside hydrolase family 2 [Candidatus Paceibacterota bacterium]